MPALKLLLLAVVGLAGGFHMSAPAMHSRVTKAASPIMGVRPTLGKARVPLARMQEAAAAEPVVDPTCIVSK